MTHTTLFVLMSVLLVSLVSLTGVFLLSLQETFLKSILLYLVSFAVGALFANVFLHMLPEIVEGSNDLPSASALILLGLVLSFVIEKFVHWRHCHHLECVDHVQPVGMMMLVGDGVHNFMDGILIAATYLVGVEVGIATTVAVILHEIPQEIGDFAVLLHSGWSRVNALALNFLSALAAFAGAIAVLLLHEHLRGIEEVLLPITAGNFLYIAGSDLIPELHKEASLQKSFLQLVAMVAGIALMMTLSQFEPSPERSLVGRLDNMGVYSGQYPHVVLPT